MFDIYFKEYSEKVFSIDCAGSALNGLRSIKDFHHKATECLLRSAAKPATDGQAIILLGRPFVRTTDASVVSIDHSDLVNNIPSGAGCGVSARIHLQHSHYAARLHANSPARPHPHGQVALKFRDSGRRTGGPGTGHDQT
jgi:hypothetical protein